MRARLFVLYSAFTWRFGFAPQKITICSFAMFPRPIRFPEYAGYSRRRRRGSSHRPKPEYDRDITAAFFALASAILLAVAEAEPRWLQLEGGRCSGNYIGLYKVIAYKSAKDLENFCYTEKVVTILRVVVAICCLGIVLSMFACLLDLCGTVSRILKCIKNNSVTNMLTALLCVVTSLLVYWVTAILEKTAKGEGDNKDVHVKFDISFYLVVAAGASSVVATGISISQCRRVFRERSIVDDEMSLELMYNMHSADSLSHLPPPEYVP